MSLIFFITGSQLTLDVAKTAESSFPTLLFLTNLLPRIGDHRSIAGKPFFKVFFKRGKPDTV